MTLMARVNSGDHCMFNTLPSPWILLADHGIKLLLWSLDRRCGPHCRSAKTLMLPITQRNMKDINTKLGILAHHDKAQLQDKGHNYESYIFGVMPLFN